MLIGYARVSTQDQTLNSQEDQLRAAGCEKIFRDVASGARAERPGLTEMLAHARRGDVIVVARLDRLGRSLAHLVETVGTLEKTKRGFRSLSESIDTTTPGGKLVFHLFAALAEFERALIQERTHAGLSAARARGRFGGRPKGPHDIQRARMAASLLGDPKNSVAEVCRVLGVSRATAYRLAQIGRESLSPQPPAATAPAETPTRTPADQRKGPATATGKASGKSASTPKKPAKPTSKPTTTTGKKHGQKASRKRKA